MSDSESSTDYSSPARATHGDETDKQILQWAGKLELESIDLKDKSSQLFLALQQNSKELQAACSQLNGTADRLDTQKDLDKFLGNMLKKFEDILVKQLKTVEKSREPAFDVEKFGSKVITDIEEVLDGRLKAIQKPPEPAIDVEQFSSKIIENFELQNTKMAKKFEQTQELVFSVMQEINEMSQVVLSLSKDLKHITERQTNLEVKLQHHEWNETVPQTPKSRSNSGRVKKLLIDASPMARRTRGKTNRSKTDASRLIIPWEEISEDDHGKISYPSEL